MTFLNTTRLGNYLDISPSTALQFFWFQVTHRFRAHEDEHPFASDRDSFFCQVINHSAATTARIVQIEDICFSHDSRGEFPSLLSVSYTATTGLDSAYYIPSWCLTQVNLKLKGLAVYSYQSSCFCEPHDYQYLCWNSRARLSFFSTLLVLVLSVHLSDTIKQLAFPSYLFKPSGTHDQWSSLRTRSVRYSIVAYAFK